MDEKLKQEIKRKLAEQAASRENSRPAQDQTVFRDTLQDKSKCPENTQVKGSPAVTRIKPAERRQHATSQASVKKPSPADATRMQNARSTTQVKSVHRERDGTRIKKPNISNLSAVNAGHQYDQNHRRVLKDRFTLEKVIGVGGMGVVYKAIDKLKVEARDREPYVAIKVLSEEFKAHPESFIALQRESRKTQRIAHPNVVKVFDFDRDGDTVFMTMEYMEGTPLDQLIKQYSATGLPRDDAWMILKGLCSALIHAHAENIVHSDFKPGNIFVTDAGIPKIFDFGIARAVANVDRLSGKGKDKTVFDAGTLGALTPAYASLEMLIGKEPDVRDDIYALGCIAYEILTGEHPFNRMPADEAFKNKLRPKKIPGITKRQWKAIEKALTFKRQDRTSSVEEFYNQLQPKPKSVSIVLPTLLVLFAIAASTYFIVTHESKPSKSNAVQVDQLEYNIRYGLFKSNIQKLLSQASFDRTWEDSIWDQVSGMMALLKNKPDKWFSNARMKIYELYIENYKQTLSVKNYKRAGELLTNAYRYTDNTKFLDAERIKLAQLVQDQKEEQQNLLARKERESAFNKHKRQQVKKDDYLFSLSLKNVEQQLQCQASLNMREFSVAISNLISTDKGKYTKLKDGFVQTLAACIIHVAKSQPERAMEDKRYALRIFKNNPVIEAIKILPLDACNRSIAGLGARGERDVCRDRLSDGSMGPAMVVIPGNGTIRTFAIGKYEISAGEVDRFCDETHLCSDLKEQDTTLPAVNIDIDTVNRYIRWLSDSAKHKYRLPTRKEWIYAAKANGNFQDPNRNCALNSRGIEKGGQLVRANTGAQNGWGLVNYLGNAQEWVYNKSHNLEAVGGSFMDSMDSCNVNTVVMQSGKANLSTGFRLVREVKH